MKYKTIAKEDTTLLTVISQAAPIGASNAKKLIKQREAKINGVRVGEDTRVKRGDEVEVFIPEAFLGEMPKIIYEDENVLIADKPILTEVEPTLTEALKGNRPYIKPLHRLDRNTVGLVAFALNEEAYDELYKAFSDKKVEKHYTAAVTGKPQEGEFVAYLFKDARQSRCYVSPSPKQGYKKIITNVSFIKKAEISLVDVKLITGRTHQIRAHLAYLGCPVLGDGKYGDPAANKKYGFKHQQLCAERLIFHGLEGKMSYLNEKVFQSERKLLTNFGQ